MKIKNRRYLLTCGLLVSTLSIICVTGLSGFAEAATCFTCHAPPGSTTDIRPVESTYRNITTGSIKGSHASHMPLPTTIANDCAPCHGPGVASYSAGHRDGFINVTSTVGVGYSKGTSFAQSGNPVLGTCSAASCHDNGKGVLVPTPVWGVSAPACTVCHAPVPGDSHPKHVTGTQYKKALCADCHFGYVQDTTVAANHLNNTIEVNSGGYTSPKIKGSAFASAVPAIATVPGRRQPAVPDCRYMLPLPGATSSSVEVVTQQQRRTSPAVATPSTSRLTLTAGIAILTQTQQAIMRQLT